MPTERPAKAFAAMLVSLMESATPPITQYRLAKATRLSSSRINNYRCGRYRAISAEHLLGIVQAVAANDDDRRALLHAYLEDILPSELVGLLVPSVSNPEIRDQQTTPKLPVNFTRRFNDLTSMCERYPTVRRHTLTWILLMERFIGEGRTGLGRVVRPSPVLKPDPVT